MNELFKRRGHGILSDVFILNVNEIIENPDSKFEVHQCNCGEVNIILKEYADSLRISKKTENIPCWKCLDEKVGKFSFVMIKKINDIITLLENNKSNLYAESSLNEIRRIGKGIIPTGSIDEVFIGINDLKKKIKDEFYQLSDISEVKYPIIDTIINDAICKDRQIAEKLLSIIDFDAKKKASANCELRYVAIEKVTTEDEKLKFLGVPYKDYFPQSSGEENKKIEINQKMSLYKDLFELGRYHLEFLLNLINVIEGKSIQKNPFNEYSIPNKKGNKKITGMFYKVQLFSRLRYGKKLYPILKDIFNNKLRNDDGHNQYEIDYQTQSVRSLKYQTEISFEELDENIAKLSRFFDYLDYFWVEHYLKSKKEIIKNLGIEEVSFCYQDSFVIDGELFPLGEVLPVLNIFQYWDFAHYDDEKRYIPQPNITINDQIYVSFEHGNTIAYPLNSNMELWLNQLFLYEKFELNLWTIAPLIPSFTDDALINPERINTMLEMNILDDTIIVVPISHELKVEIRKILEAQ